MPSLFCTSSDALTLSCVNIGDHFLYPGVAAGVFGGAAAAAGQAEDAQVRLGEVQTAAPADGQQVSLLHLIKLSSADPQCRSCHCSQNHIFTYRLFFSEYIRRNMVLDKLLTNSKEIRRMFKIIYGTRAQKINYFFLNRD
jgi:hypothetical protein